MFCDLSTMALGTKHVSSFSANGKLFALINEQGILRIWDTETNQLKQEYTPNLHLSGPCTAFTWLNISRAEENGEATPKKAPKKQKKTKDVLYLALGTSKGQVSLYSYVEGKVERNLAGEGHTGRITAIVSDEDGNLYTAGDDCQIVEWSLTESKRTNSWNIGNEKATSLTYCKHSKKLVLGCRQIKIFCLESEEIVQTFIGHSSEVEILNTFEYNNNEYVISSSKMERVLSVWKIGKKGFNKPAAFSLIMEDVGVCITCYIKEDDESLKVASVTRTGIIHMYIINLVNLKTNKPYKPNVTLEIVSDSETIVEPFPAVAATLEYAVKEDSIKICYGSSHFLVFEDVELKYEEKIQVLIRKDPKKLGKTFGNKKNDNNVGVLKSLNPIVDHANVEYKSAVNIPKKKQQNDLPMENRLKSLNLANEPTSTPQAQSKVQLLMQSLHSKDVNLMRAVLCTKDINVIQSTLRKLPIEYVQPLTDELTSLLQMKRINIEYAILWLKTLSQTHSSQLLAMGLEDLTEKFGCCIGIIEHRLNCLSELSKFNGRLQLLVSQIKTNIEVEDIDNDVLVYQDEDSDEEWYKLDEDKSSADKNFESSNEEMDNDDDDDDIADGFEQNGFDSDNSEEKHKNMDVSDDENNMKIFEDEMK